MDLVERVKKICLSPSAEWPVIAQETAPAGTLVTGYVLPLAAVSAVAGFVGGSIVGMSLPFAGTFRIPITTGLAGAIIAIVMAVVGVYLMSFIINALAPTFGAVQDSAQSFKVAVYSFTPAWVAGICQILPGLSILALLGALYGLYLLYLGLPVLMKSPVEKAAGYTAVVAVCAIVVSMIFGAISVAVAGTAALGSRGFGSMLGGAPAASSSDVQFDRDTPMGKLQELGQKLEQTGKKMEDAERRGDKDAQASAALEGLGTLLGGGRRVDPVSLEQLKPFVPETFMGLPRTNSNAERSGLGSVMVAKAEGTYSTEGKHVTLEVTDTGGVSGLMMMAGWVQGEKQTDEGSERTQRVGDRLVHEKSTTRSGGTNEFAVVLADRFIVNAEGRGVSLDELKAAVSGLNLAGIEAMKAVGAKP